MGLTGIVLAGGASRRMGDDKRGMPVDGVPMLRRAVDAVAPLVSQLIVVEHPARPIDPRWLEGVDAELARDLRPGGPLAGIEAGLLATRNPWALVVGADMPWLRASVLDLLVSTAKRAGPRVDVVAVESAPGLLEPLLAAYRRRCLRIVRDRLGSGEWRLQDVLRDLCVVPVSGEAWRRLDPAGRSLTNVNTPSDLRGGAPRADR